MITSLDDPYAILMNADEKELGEYEHYFKAMINKVKSVLANNPDNIPDMKVSIDFQNGSLIDRDVKYGFGPDQLKTWFDDIMSGVGNFNARA
jgi:hypothetical protein